MKGKKGAAHVPVAATTWRAVKVRASPLSVLRVWTVKCGCGPWWWLIEMCTGKIRNITKTLTWDQGVELAQVDRLSIARGLAVYFCDPHSPWQRPTNENTNGLVRDFLPKGSDFSTLTGKGVQQIQDLLNGRPRKVLNWYTPEEKIQELFK